MVHDDENRNQIIIKIIIINLVSYSYCSNNVQDFFVFSLYWEGYIYIFKGPWSIEEMLFYNSAVGQKEIWYQNQWEICVTLTDSFAVEFTRR